MEGSGEQRESLDASADNQPGALGYCASTSGAGPVLLLYRRRWVILAIFSMVSLMNEVMWISFASISETTIHYYGVSARTVNWLAMSFNVLYIFAPFGTLVLKKYGLKTTIITAAVLNAIASYFRFAGYKRDGFIFLRVGNVFAAIGQCFVLFVPPTLAAKWFSDTERAKATSIGVLANVLGIALGFLMGSLLVPSGSKDYNGVIKQRIKLSLLVQTVLCTVLVILSVTFLKDSPFYAPSMSQYLLRKKELDQLDLGAILQNDRARYYDRKLVERNAETDVEFQIPEDDVTNRKTNERASSGNRDQHIKNRSCSMVSTMVDLNQSNSRKSWTALKKLSKNISFHLLVQGFAFYSSPFLAYTVNLNEWCSRRFPDRELVIGMMGFAAIICGLIALLLTGVLIDKTHRYKLMAVVITVCNACALLLFTLLLNYTDNFCLVFASFCVVGFFSYPFVPVSLEYAADLTYPISEGITSTILFIVTNLYGTITIYVIGIMLEKGRGDVVGYIMVGMYVCAVLCLLFIKGNLNRYNADKSSSIQTADVSIEPEQNGKR